MSIATAPPSLITTTIGRLSSKFSNYQHEDGRPHEQRHFLRGRIIFHRFEHLYAMTVNGAVREQNRNNTIPTSLNAFSVHDIVAVHRPRLPFITSLPRMERQPSALEGIRHRRQPHFRFSLYRTAFNRLGDFLRVRWSSEAYCPCRYYWLLERRFSELLESDPR